MDQSSSILRMLTNVPLPGAAKAAAERRDRLIAIANEKAEQAQQAKRQKEAAVRAASTSAREASEKARIAKETTTLAASIADEHKKADLAVGPLEAQAAKDKEDFDKATDTSKQIEERYNYEAYRDEVRHRFGAGISSDYGAVRSLIRTEEVVSVYTHAADNINRSIDNLTAEIAATKCEIDQYKTGQLDYSRLQSEEKLCRLQSELAQNNKALHKIMDEDIPPLMSYIAKYNRYPLVILYHDKMRANELCKSQQQTMEKSNEALAAARTHLASVANQAAELPERVKQAKAEAQAAATQAAKDAAARKAATQAAEVAAKGAEQAALDAEQAIADADDAAEAIDRLVFNLHHLYERSNEFFDTLDNACWVVGITNPAEVKRIEKRFVQMSRFHPMNEYIVNDLGQENSVCLTYRGFVTLCTTEFRRACPELCKAVLKFSAPNYNVFDKQSNE